MAIGLLTQISTSSTLDNWPKSAWRAPNEDIDWESWWNSVVIFDEDNLPDRSNGHRGRSKRVSQGQDTDGDTELRDLDEITLGHPEARGCKGCFELRQRCPLLDEGSRYPCDMCVQDGYDCELVTEPLRKRACLNW